VGLSWQQGPLSPGAIGRFLVGRISDLVSFEPDIVSVQLDNRQLHLDPGQSVIPLGPGRDLDAGEALRPANS
jgi:hypothetical protein